MENNLDKLLVINFTNIDDEDFVGVYGGEKKVIKSGQTIPLPKFLAEHYAKHLMDKMILKEGKDYGQAINRDPLMAKILGNISVYSKIEVVLTPETGEKNAYYLEPVAEMATTETATTTATPEFQDIPKENSVKEVIVKKVGRPKKQVEDIKTKEAPKV
jgi:hypothetical protein